MRGRQHHEDTDGRILKLQTVLPGTEIARNRWKF